MKLRLYKKLYNQKIKQFRIEDGELLVVDIDTKKISPENAGQILRIISSEASPIKTIGLINGLTLSKMTKSQLINYRDNIQSQIDKLGD